MSTISYASLTKALAARKVQSLFGFCPKCSRRCYSKVYVKENDIVLLKRRGIDDTKPILTKHLQPTGRIHSHRGTIDHASLIGKEVRDVVYTNKGVAYRIHQPTLAEYVALSPRIVTPVYPADANLIVSLLDIHPSINPQDVVKDEPFEIFEAGTGHGALTLHLARAIHGLNPAPPPLPIIQKSDKPSTGELAIANPTVPNSERAHLEISMSSMNEQNIQNGDVPSYSQDYEPIKKLIIGPDNKSVGEVNFEAYLNCRRAVIHTLDISPAISQHAQDIVRNFRRGLYYDNIDFHVGTIPEYLSSRLAGTHEPFLEHTILDLPNPQKYLDIIGQALKLNGSLILFCPSITQIADCVKVIRDKRLPFHLESVLELGVGAGVGGREWDVRLVKPRAVLKAEAEARKAKEGSDEVSEAPSADDASSLPIADEGSGWSMVCRPKVGVMVTGGGFLALWRRMGATSSSAHRPQPVSAIINEAADVNEPEIKPVRDPESRT